jgi:hypothetical protein
MLGKEIFVSAAEDKSFMINISEWECGIYAYRVLSKNASIAGKFIKQ